MSEALQSWLESIWASVLFLHSGPMAILELYYPHRTTRNFGYDQTVLPHWEFMVSTRLYDKADAHVQAAAWWNFFQRITPNTLFEVPIIGREGQTYRAYTDWWSRHCHSFRCSHGDIKIVEHAYLHKKDMHTSTFL